MSQGADPRTYAHLSRKSVSAFDPMQTLDRWYSHPLASSAVYGTIRVSLPPQLPIRLVDGLKQFAKAWHLVDGISAAERRAEELQLRLRDEANCNDALLAHQGATIKPRLGGNRYAGAAQILAFMLLYCESQAPITPGELDVSLSSLDRGCDHARRALLFSSM